MLRRKLRTKKDEAFFACIMTDYFASLHVLWAVSPCSITSQTHPRIHPLCLPDWTAFCNALAHCFIPFYGRPTPLEFWGSPTAPEFLSSDRQSSIFWGSGLEVLLLCPRIFSDNAISMYSFNKYLLNNYWMPRVGRLPCFLQWQLLCSGWDFKP